MRVIFVASEAVPHAKTGGLADVVGALPRYLKDLGVETTTLIPRYKGIAAPVEKKMKINLGKQYEVGVCRQGDFMFIDYPPFFDREGLYGDASGDYADNFERFTLFNLAALEIVKDLECEIVHCHDWQSGLLPLYIKRFGVKAKSIFTIHNLG